MLNSLSSRWAPRPQCRQLVRQPNKCNVYASRKGIVANASHGMGLRDSSVGKDAKTSRLPLHRSFLEVETYRASNCARGYVVCAAEG
jgi:hypothetical protein